MAVGVGAMQKIVAASPALAVSAQFRGFSNLNTIDVMAARLWLDRKVTPPSASNVIAGFER